MNSCKFRILGLVVTTLFITSLMASPNRVGNNPMELTITKEASSVISQNELRSDKVGEVISASELSIGSALGINGGEAPAKDGVVLAPATQSSWRFNDRTEYVIHNEGRPDCPDGYIIDLSLIHI